MQVLCRVSQCTHPPRFRKCFILRSCFFASLFLQVDAQQRAMPLLVASTNSVLDNIMRQARPPHSKASAGAWTDCENLVCNPLDAVP